MNAESQPTIDPEAALPLPGAGQIRSRRLVPLRSVGPNFVRIPTQAPEPIMFLEPVVELDLLPLTLAEQQAAELTEQ